jgi:hypothetical protein
MDQGCGLLEARTGRRPREDRGLNGLSRQAIDARRDEAGKFDPIEISTH